MPLGMPLRLDAGNDVAVTHDRFTSETNVGTLDIHRVAFGYHAGASDIDKDAASLRGILHHINDFGDAIGALRSRIDESSHTIAKDEFRPFCHPAGVGMDVD